MRHYMIQSLMDAGESNTYEAEENGQRYQVTEGYAAERTFRHDTAMRLYDAAQDADGAVLRHGVINWREGDTTFALKHGTTRTTQDTMSLTWQTITPLD